MQLPLPLLYFSAVCLLHTLTFSPLFLEKQLLQPRFQSEAQPDNAVTCLELYAFYKGKCPGSREACLGSECASALDAFKCCLKQSFATSQELQLSGLQSQTVTRWEVMSSNPLWTSIRRSLILRSEACKKHGFEPLNACPVPDIPPVKVDEKVSQTQYETALKHEILSEIDEIEVEEQQIHHDIDDFGLSDQVEMLSELRERESVLRSRLSSY